MAVGMFAAFTVYSFATTFAKISDQQDKAERAKILAKLDARTKEVNRLEAELASGGRSEISDVSERSDTVHDYFSHSGRAIKTWGDACTCRSSYLHNPLVQSRMRARLRLDRPHDAALHPSRRHCSACVRTPEARHGAAHAHSRRKKQRVPSSSNVAEPEDA